MVGKFKYVRRPQLPSLVEIRPIHGALPGPIKASHNDVAFACASSLLRVNVCRFLKFVLALLLGESLPLSHSLYPFIYYSILIPLVCI